MRRVVDDTEWDDAPAPQVSWTLGITNHRMHTEFLLSPEYKDLFRTLYNCSMYIMITVSALLVRRTMQKAQSFGVAISSFFAGSTLIAALVWNWKVLRAPAHKRFAMHKTWLLTLKLHLMVYACSLMFVMRFYEAEGFSKQASDAALFEPDDTHSASLLIAIRNSMITSGAIVPLLAGIAAPLTFRMAVLSQLLFLAIPLVGHQNGGLRLLSCAGPSGGIKHLCNMMDEGISTLQLMVLGYLPHRLWHQSVACSTERHVVTVALFLQLICAYVPLHISYRLEWLAKMRYLQRVLNAGNAVASPFLHDVGFAIYSVIAVWTVTLTFQDSILRLLSIPALQRFHECLAEGQPVSFTAG